MFCKGKSDENHIHTVSFGSRKVIETSKFITSFQFTLMDEINNMPVSSYSVARPLCGQK
jgi:hypothetical protein